MNTLHIEIPNGSIDEHLRRFRDPGTVFHLGNGIYTTQGSFAFESHDLCMLASGCQLIGNGPKQTRLITEDVDTHIGGKDAQYFEALIVGARTKGTASGMRLEGFSLQLPSYKPVIGIHVYGNRSVVKDVVVTGVAGFRGWSGDVDEGFGILINPPHEIMDIEGGNVVDGCSVFMANLGAENYSTGIYMGMVQRSQPMLRCHLRNSIVVSVDGHAGLAFNDRTEVEGCEVYGTRRAIFMDTGPVRQSCVTGLRAHDVAWGLDLRLSAAGVTHEDVQIRDSHFGFRALDGYSQAARIEDDFGKGGSVNSVAFTGCTFVAAKEAAQASKARLNGKEVQNVTFAGCRWVGDWNPPILQGGARL
jgi:hypothetical protein